MLWLAEASATAGRSSLLDELAEAQNRDFRPRLGYGPKSRRTLPDMKRQRRPFAGHGPAPDQVLLPWNKSGANSARLRRQTIQVCAPGVSMSV